MSDPARQAVARAARESHGRLLAYLARRSHDLAACEDALADAFRLAIEHWSVSGLPSSPEAWLLTVARRRLLDFARRDAVRHKAHSDLLLLTGEALEIAREGARFPDERLGLMFVCAHPEIGEDIRTPLMLQTVLGLSAARIASAFLVAPATMGQRLVRAKSLIRQLGIAFAVPEASELPARLEAVLQAIYAVYGIGWDHLDARGSRLQGMTAEAVELARLLLSLMPDEPEVQGLLALILLVESRKAARRDAHGGYVPLSEQETTLWSRDLMAEADGLLSSAAAAGRLGRFQLEAAIQAVHARRAFSGRTDWEAIVLLYEGMAALAPTMSVLVGRAAALGEARGAAMGWDALCAIPRQDTGGYQPYWALAAHLLVGQGRWPEARQAYGRAIGLSEDESLRAFLQRKAAEIP